MNKQELQAFLNGMLIGKELDLSKHFNQTAYDVKCALKNEFGEVRYWDITSDYDNRVIWFYYKKCHLFGFRVKTKRVYKHTCYVYIIESVSVLNDFDMSKDMDDIDVLVEKNNQKKIEEDNAMYEIYKQIITLVGKDKVSWVAYYIYQNGYELNKRFKEEESKK